MLKQPLHLYRPSDLAWTCSMTCPAGHSAAAATSGRESSITKGSLTSAGGRSEAGRTTTARRLRHHRRNRTHADRPTRSPKGRCWNHSRPHRCSRRTVDTSSKCFKRVSRCASIFEGEKGYLPPQPASTCGKIVGATCVSKEGCSPFTSPVLGTAWRTCLHHR